RRPAKGTCGICQGARIPAKRSAMGRRCRTVAHSSRCQRPGSGCGVTESMRFDIRVVPLGGDGEVKQCYSNYITHYNVSCTSAANYARGKETTACERRHATDSTHQHQ